MPIYEYSCHACQGVSEIIQKIDAPAPEECPKCEAKGQLVKLMSRSAFILKGGGWYETDFRGGGPRAAEKPASKDATTSAAAPAAATDGGATKSEAKTEAAPAKAAEPAPAATKKDSGTPKVSQPSGTSGT